jgi:hypothetical protein
MRFLRSIDQKKGAMKSLRLLVPVCLGIGLAAALLVGVGAQSGLALGMGTGNVSAPNLPLVQIRYITKSGVDQGGCGDPLTPCRTIQYAVDQAEAGDELRIAGGVYTGVNTYAGMGQVVYISKTLSLRGSYTLTDWITPDYTIHPTILDAQDQGRVISIVGPITTTLEGLRLTRGNNYPTYDNSDGGGVYAIGANVSIRGCEVISNITPVFGGGIYLRNGFLSIENSAIGQNFADSGGGIYASEGEVNLKSNHIFSNTGIYGGGGGGGMYVTIGNITATANTIEGNYTEGEGGGLYVETNKAVLDKNTICNNYAFYGGGGLRIRNLLSILSNNLICDNSSALSGGGLSMEWGKAEIVANQVIDNFSDDPGAGLHLSDIEGRLNNNVLVGNHTDSWASGILVYDSQLYWSQNTIAHNLGGDGVGIYVLADHINPSTLVLTNTILVSQTVGLQVTEYGKVTLEGTLWGGGDWANGMDWTGDGQIVTGTVNLWGDPKFLNPVTEDYHITSSSAAIDAGVDSGVLTDVDGEARPAGGGFDLGADEYWVPRQAIYLPVIVR